MATRRTGKTAVYLEVGARRVFACSLDWPGWCRAGKDEQQALDALAAAAPRYADVARVANIDFAVRAATAFEVVERLPGDATTDFGAPSRVAERDDEPLSEPAAERLAALVAASWTVLDRVVAGAPAELRKGPRGGGRDRDAIVAHVVAAEVGYARQLGLKLREPGDGDRAALVANRNAMLAALRAAAVPSAEAAPTKWPPRYAARRIAWHALDHAWEIEDRSVTG